MNETLNTNNFIFTYDTTPLTEVCYQKENNIVSGGNNMEALLQRYKNYLCGEHSNKNTIDNKYAATRLLLRQERIEQEDQGLITYSTVDRHVKKDEKRYHLKSLQHDWYISRGLRCPSCVAGSIPETEQEYKIRKQNEKLRE